jgi:D-alanine-D-alanine ligase
MEQIRIGLLQKKRGNFALQEKMIGAKKVIDETPMEIAHHEKALLKAGYEVIRVPWGPHIINDLQDMPADIVFNVSSLAEAALLEDLEIPYVGSDPFATAAATDKSIAKRLWRQAGLPTAPFVVARRVEDCKIFSQRPPVQYPLFIKPVAGRGSSGIDSGSVVHSYAQLVRGVEQRIKTIGQPVLIEKFLQGREITIGILGNENARVLSPLEIVYRDGDTTLTYEKKALDDDTFLCPAPLDGTQTRLMQELALRAYQSLGMRDYGRIDTILTADGPFLLEANAFAGLMCDPVEKPHSYIGFMARAEGMDGADLLGEIIECALRRSGMLEAINCE